MEDMTSDETPTSEAQELIWALLDEQISDADFERLQTMIASDEAVRRLYVQCVQIHVDLQQWFGSAESAPDLIRDNTGGRVGGITLDMPMTSDGSSLADPAI